MELDVDRWEGNLEKGETIKLSGDDFDVVADNLRKLNQKEFTQLILGNEDSYLLVGGGNGQYVCTFTEREDEEYFNLINENEEQGDSEVAVVTGGQKGFFPRTLVVDFETALSAVKFYYDHTEMSPELRWEKD